MWQQSICFSGYIQETKWNGNETLLQYSHNFKTFNSLINVSKARCCWWCGGDPNLTVERRWEKWRGCEEDWTGGERGHGAQPIITHHRHHQPIAPGQHAEILQVDTLGKYFGVMLYIFLISDLSLFDVKSFSPQQGPGGGLREMMTPLETLQLHFLVQLAVKVKYCFVGSL